MDWMYPEYRHMMCDRLRQMIGEMMRAEVRHPDGGTQIYIGRLVLVGNDYIEMEVEDPSMTASESEDKTEAQQFGFWRGGRFFRRVIIPLLLLSAIFPFFDRRFF